MEQDGFAQLQKLLEKAVEGKDQHFLDVLLKIIKTLMMVIIKSSYDQE